MTTARVLAQAKINLVLHVLAPETSGYHSIETVFLRLDLSDAIAVRVDVATRTVDCAGPAVPAAGLGPAETNLAYRAASVYAEATGWPSGFAIEIDKRIPVGAGLGGGSADAGAVLRALDAMAPNALGHRLAELAAPLGADVPFMAIDSPMALAWGRGERLLPLPVLAPRPVAVLVPPFPIATRDAYGWLADSRGPYVPEARVIAPEALATWEGVSGIAWNDFDDALRPRFAKIGQLIDHLESAGADVAMLSGSGSAVFGVFPVERDLASLGSPAGARLIVTRTSDRVVRVDANR